MAKKIDFATGKTVEEGKPSIAMLASGDEAVAKMIEAAKAEAANIIDNAKAEAANIIQIANDEAEAIKAQGASTKKGK